MWLNKFQEAFQLVMEGQNEDRALAMLKKAGKEKDFEKLLVITNDKKNNNKHLPILVNYFLNGESIDTIESYYERFASNTKINQKPIDNLTFREFEQMVDGAVVSNKGKLKNVEDKPIYEDENVKIFLGLNNII